MAIETQVRFVRAENPEPTEEFLAREAAGEIPREQAGAYRGFLTRVFEEFLTHPIVVDNRYTRWFQDGRVTDAELRHFAAQFSVFSNQFLVAQLQKMINADSLAGMRSAKEILANEIGVIFKPADGRGTPSRELSAEAKDREGDPDLVSTTGSVDGGTFRFRAGHFEWLVRFGAGLGLGFNDMGKRRHGSAATLHFCDELIRLLASDDTNLACGASFALENWAAAGFWQELEDGLGAVKRARLPQLSLAFFTWHNRVEMQHAGHLMHELEQVYFQPGFDQAQFLRGGRQMLEALAVFWNGLERDRLGNPPVVINLGIC